jgi:hypothetical protein
MMSLLTLRMHNILTIANVAMATLKIEPVPVDITLSWKVFCILIISIKMVCST